MSSAAKTAMMLRTLRREMVMIGHGQMALPLLFSSSKTTLISRDPDLFLLQAILV